MSIRATDLDPPAPMIPGGYERNTLTHRNPGSMGADPRVAVPAGPGTMDAATIADREREGGGAPSQRRRKAQTRTQAQARTAPALGEPEPGGFRRTGGLWFQILRLARR